MSTKLEYIWLDGTEPTTQLRSKTKVIEDFGHSISDCPEWNFDGSSTNQTEGSNSDCVLRPVKMYDNPLDGSNSYLILCEVFDISNNPHKSNFRFQLDNI